MALYLREQGPWPTTQWGLKRHHRQVVETFAASNLGMVRVMGIENHFSCVKALRDICRNTPDYTGEINVMTCNGNIYLWRESLMTPRIPECVLRRRAARRARNS